MKDFKQFLSESKYPAFVVNVIEDKNFLVSHYSEIMTLINNAYAPLGGYKGRPLSKKTTFDMVDLAKIVFDRNHNMIALALYSKHLGGNKRFCSAGIRGNQESREAVENIVKHDIAPYDGWYWVEASGTIEKLFKKSNGNPIPNHLAHKFLQKPAKDLVLDDDGIHYTRSLGEHGPELKKMIFGFKNLDYAKKAMEAVDNYEKFKKDVNQAVEEILEDDSTASKVKKELTGAIYITNSIEDWQEYGELNELTPTMAKELQGAIDSLTRLKSDSSLSGEERQMAKSNLVMADGILSSTPVLRLQQFHAVK